MEKRYVSDIIGDDYKKWCAGDKVLISHGTGGGKTWFVLRVLLKHAKEQGKHLVYFCNRKFLSKQVQSAAEKLLLNELGEDEEDLAKYLHIRTYQHSERVFDYPDIKALDENGKLITYEEWPGHTTYQMEVTQDHVLYYVYDESFYIVADASFNAQTHHWYDKAAIWKNKNSISVFLAATPEPLLLYAQFRYDGVDLKELSKRCVAAYSIAKNEYQDRWVRYYYPPYVTADKGYRQASFRNDKDSAETFRNQIYSQVVEECQNPYKDFFDNVEKAYDSGKLFFNYVYQDERTPQQRYDYLNTFYFDDIAMLAERIALSVKNNCNEDIAESEKQRWLVFVRSYEDASTLRSSLRLLGCKSIAISAKITKRYDGTPCKRRGSVKKTLETLVHQEELNCDVLISTSVLDCGISIKNISNMAICQPNKTSFLQMIGRIRVQDGARVNLYIQSFSPSEIRGYRDDVEKMFVYLNKLYLKDETIHKSDLGYGNEPNISEYENFMVDGMISLLPTTMLLSLKDKQEKDQNRLRYLYYDDHGNKALRIRHHLEPKVNPMAILYYLSQLYFYKVQVPKQEGDQYYFLKEQLSWLGKTYDPAAWLDYQSSRDQICGYLAEVSQHEPMYKSDREIFREKCFEFLRGLREPPQSLIEAKKRHPLGSGTHPGKSKLNDIFTDAGIPYQIRSPQNKKLLIDKETGEKVIDPKTGKPKVNNKSPWIVVPTDVEMLRSDLERKRTEKRLKQEMKKAESQPQVVPNPDSNVQEKLENSSKTNKVDPIQQNPPIPPMKIIVRKGEDEIFRSQ